MKMNKREKTLLTILIVVLLLMVLLLVFILPTAVKTKQKRSNIAKLNDRIGELEFASMTYASLAIQKSGSENAYADKEFIFSESLEDSQILRTLNTVISPYSDDLKLNFPNSKNKKNAETALIKEIAVDARMTVSSYADLMNILSKLNLEDAGCAVADLSYRPIEGNGLSVTMSVIFLGVNSK